MALKAARALEGTTEEACRRDVAAQAGIRPTRTHRSQLTRFTYFVPAPTPMPRDPRGTNTPRTTE
ncbi:hypothetical protein LguiB_035842 [Lonicera macranthoides]